MPYASELVALIDADTRRFDQKAAGVDRTLKRLASSDPEVTVSVDDTRAQADIRSVEAALTGIEDQTVGISADATDARSEVQTVEAALAGIEDETVGISADAAQARGEVQGVSAALAAIGDETVAVTANASQARAEVQTVEAALAGIEDQDVRVTADTRTAAANVQSLEAALAGLEDQTVKVTQETQNAGGAAMGMGGQLKGAAATAGMLRGSLAGIATGAVAMGFWNIASAASDLGESANVVNINFGRAADEMFAFTSDAPRALGMSTRAANEMSAGLAGLLGNMGFAQDETLSWSKDLLTLGADMGSAFNAEPAEAVAAIGSALRGETEPIRRFNVMLSAAKVETEAVTMGLHDGEGALSDYAKAAATLSIIMRDTETVQGDFANTADGMANSTRSLTGEFENFRATLGEDLAPAIAEVQQGLIGLLEQADKNRASFGAWVGGLFNVGEGARDAMPPVRDLTAEEYNLAEAARMGRDASGGLADGLGGVADAADDARGPVDKFQDALDRLIGINLSAESAQIRFEEALHTVTGSLKENTHHLDSNSAEALKARGDVVSLGEAALRTAESMTTEGATVSEVSAQLATNRQRMIDHMVQGGMTRGEADKFIGSLGFTEQNLKMVAGELGLNSEKLRTMAGAAQETTTKVGGLTGRLFEAAGGAIEAKRKTDELRGSVDISGSSAVIAGGKFGTYKLDINNVPGDKTTNVHTPGLGPAVEGMGKLAGLINGIGRDVVINLKSSFGFGDGPGNIRAAGSAMARARAAATGLPVRMTSGYRPPARNRAVGGSPTSYHMDAGNPASDWVGPTWALDELARRLRAAGGYRELLWRVPNHAPGDNPHVHYAHTGGIVDRAWGTLPGLRADERPVIAQVGEGILSRSDMAALASSGGSSAPVTSSTFSPTIHIHIPANAPDAATVSRLAYDAAKAGTAEAFAEERRRNLAMNGRR